MTKKFGSNGNDELIGGTGSDLLYGNRGEDRLDGADGHDRLYGNAGNDRLIGGTGNDDLDGGVDDDLASGGAGDDRLYGNRGDDHLDGGDGDDQLDGNAHDDHLIGGTGNDDLDGGAGNDRLYGGDGHDLLEGDHGDDRLEGDDGDDRLYGDRGEDHLDGGDGDDSLDGNASSDRLIGGTGNDDLDGGVDDDLLSGGADDDRLEGDRGNDQLDGGTGDDQLYGNAGDDLFTYRTGDGDDDIDGGAGAADVLRLEVEDGWIVDLCRGEVVSDEGGRMHLSDNASGRITLADGSTIRFRGIEQIDASASAGDANRPPIDLSVLAQPVAENAAEGTVVGTATASDPDPGDTLTYALTDDAAGRFAIDPSSGVIRVAAGASLDHENALQHGIEVQVTDAGGLGVTQSFTIAVANVNEAPGVVNLSAGEVIEGAADGTVVGTVTATDPDIGDALTYALSDDAGGRFAIDPDSGVITVADGSLLDHENAAQHGIEVEVTDAGGLSQTATCIVEVKLDNTGDDVLTGGAGADVIDGGPGGDIVSGMAGDDHLLGGDGDDSLDGGEGDDRLEGGDGDDFLFGLDGDDHLDGGQGNDQLLSGMGDDWLEGGDGDDELFGNSGADDLLGGAGNDTLFGSLGDDVLAGGAGNDELSGGAGNDRFVLAGPEGGVDQVLDFGVGDVLAIGDMLAGFAAGEEAAFVRLVDAGADISLQVDVDGAANGAAYQPIAVLSGLAGATLAELVDAGQLDFWGS